MFLAVRLTTSLREYRVPEAHEIATLFERWVPEQLMAWATAGVLTMTVCVVVAGLSRWLLVKSALKRRNSICQLLPTDTFRPTLEDIARYGVVLGRAHRASRALGARRAAAVRLRLVGRGGEVTYGVEGSERARSLLRQPAYREVEAISPLDDD